MASKKKITKENLQTLGVARLAELLEEFCNNDTFLAKRMHFILAAEEGSDKLSAIIGKQISSIAQSSAFVDWQKTSAYIDEIDDLRNIIVTMLAKADPVKAIEHLWSFLALYIGVSKRLEDGNNDAIDIFTYAVDNLAELYLVFENLDEIILAEKVFETLEANDLEIFLSLVKVLREVLGNKGRAHLKTALMKVPEDTKGGSIVSSVLMDLADADKDVDAYIAIVNECPDRISNEVAKIAKRLLAANRPQDALMWLNKPVDSHWNSCHERIDLKILTLEQLSRKSEAQTLRLARFNRTLSIDYLRDYLKFLPDFEDFKAEQEAISHAETFPNFLSALSFLVNWPALESASRLVHHRYSEINGKAYETLNFAADTLSEKYPDAATRIYRYNIISVLDKSRNKYYPLAVRDLQNCASIAKQISPTPTLPGHDIFVACLREKHGRKLSFWNKIDS